MKIKVPEAEILRTPIKIEKLSLWNRSRSGFIMNFEFHGFLEKKHSLPVHYFATSFGREIVYSLPVHYFATSFGREIVYFATRVYIKEIVYFATQGYVKEIVYFATCFGTVGSWGVPSSWVLTHNHWYALVAK